MIIPNSNTLITVNPPPQGDDHSTPPLSPLGSPPSPESMDHTCTVPSHILSRLDAIEQKAEASGRELTKKVNQDDLHSVLENHKNGLEVLTKGQSLLQAANGHIMKNWTEHTESIKKAFDVVADNERGIMEEVRQVKDENVELKTQIDQLQNTVIVQSQTIDELEARIGRLEHLLRFAAGPNAGKVQEEQEEI